MTKRLYRSREYKIIGGVCGGLGEYFNIDPVIMRALFVITTICWGFGILAYIILWVITPMEKFVLNSQKKIEIEPLPEDEKNSEFSKQHNKTALAIILIIVGSLWLMNNTIPSIDFINFWPIALIALGIYILLKSPNYKQNEALK